MMETKQAFWRAIATIVIWVMLTGGFGIVSETLTAQLGEDVIAVLIMQLLAAVICTGFVWNWGRIPGDQKRAGARKEEAWEELYDDLEKPKRDRLANALRTLSDDELFRLKDRIRSGAVDDRVLEQTLLDEESNRR
jgi:hypothetical protein